MKTDQSLKLSTVLPGFDSYLLSERRFSKGTTEKYRENILWLIRHRGDTAIADIDFRFLVDLKSSLVPCVGASRLAGIVYALKSILVYARDVLSIRVMNVDLIRAPGAPRREVVYLSTEEYNEFVEAIPLYTGFGRARLSQFCFRALVETLAATGMRISEALSLNTDSIDLAKREAVIVGKGNRQRTVFFTDRSVAWVRRYLQMRTGTTIALFAGLNGCRLQIGSVQAMFRRANASLLARSGKRITPHILRHTAATNLLQRGCPVGHIKEILGHQNLETTCRFYLGTLAKEDVRKAFDTFMTYEHTVESARIDYPQSKVV